MTASELTARVTVTTALAVVALALVAGWLGGTPVLAGVLAGGTLAVLGFRALASRATVAGAATGWLLTAGLRFAAVGAILAVLFVTGWAHPIGVLVGYSALPVIVVVHGLRLARESASWR